MPDYASIFKEINNIFNICAREFSQHLQQSSNKRRDGLLVVQQFRAGSLEILADPYFTGAVSGVVANGICHLFVYVMRRINGKPRADPKLPLGKIDAGVITQDRLQEAVKAAVAASTSDRRYLLAKHTSLGLSITITINAESYRVTDTD